MAHDPFTVALTGGVASGKSLATERFAALGASVIDADDAAREVVARGSDALAEIVDAFGPGVLDADGALDRRAMRERIFADGNARRRLEAIVHPRVRSLLRERARIARGAYVLLAIPLLIESGHYDWVDRVLVIDVPRGMQRARLVARDRITPELADAMLDAQATREQRVAIADDVIVNDANPTQLLAAVDTLHARYIDFARQAKSL